MATVNRLTGRTTDYPLVKSVTEYSSPLKNKERKPIEHIEQIEK